jgi:ankyrin repeat protein
MEADNTEGMKATFETISSKHEKIAKASPTKKKKIRHSEIPQPSEDLPDSPNDEPREHQHSHLARNEKKLLEASMNGDLQLLIRLLSEEVVNINCHDRFGISPVHNAAFYGRVKCLQYLIDTAASVNMRDSNGCTPLHNTAIQNNQKCLKMLLDHYADPNEKDVDGNTALHKAVYKGKFLFGCILRIKRERCLCQNASRRWRWC